MPSEPDGADRSADLLRRWQEGEDRDALDELLRIEVGILKHRLRRRGRAGVDPSASVSDAAQEAVIGMLKASPAPRFRDPRALRAYLWKASRRLLARHLRRAGRRPVRLDDGDSRAIGEALVTTGGLQAIDAAERRLALDTTLNLLAPSEREVLDLVYFEKLAMDEVCRRLSITKDAGYMRLVRARRSLAKRLRHWTGLIG